MQNMPNSRPLIILSAILVLIVAACAPTTTTSDSTDAEAAVDASAAGSQVSTSEDETSEGSDQRQDFELTGVIEALDGSSITLLGFSFAISEDTLLDEGLAVDVVARVEYVILGDNSLLALSVETDADDDGVTGSGVDGEGSNEDDSQEDEHISGIIQALSGTSVTINGLDFTINADTLLDEGLALGVLARVEFLQLADGTLLAIEIETDASDDPEGDADEDDHRSGVIQALTATSVTINGITYAINANTELDDGLDVGVFARLEFVQLADGTLLALEIETDADDNDDRDGGDDEDDDNSGSDDDDDEDDNSGSGSSNSGSGSSDDDDDDDD